MTEHPILFNTEMVQPIPDGRKTRTTRPIKHLPLNVATIEKKGNKFIAAWDKCKSPRREEEIRCPWGIAGDHLWVKETFGNVSHTFDADENIIPWVPDRPAMPIHDMKFGRRLPRANLQT